MLIFVITILSALADLPRVPVNIKYDGSNSSVLRKILGEKANGVKIDISTEIGGYFLSLFNGKFTRDLEVKKGLDISGGVSVLLQADISKISFEDKEDALKSLRDVIERRVNLLGISEASVQTSRFNDEYRVIVELAGVFNAEEALSVIGQTAQLEFRTEAPAVIPEDSTDSAPLDVPSFEHTDLTGADLKKASVGFDTQGSVPTNEPIIQLQFNAEGTRKFKDITEKSLGKRVAIYLDETPIIAPVVESVITDGQAIIRGQFTLDEAKLLVTELNAGALPVPVKVLEQRTVGPSLGQESVVKSVYAGFVGLALVIAFMILYYGRLGIMASIALTIYGIVTLALYKLIPVVLTLPGLAGFILSIGMAVDANILIFERIKEELHADKPLSIALENGFGRSWDSIRDANMATLITTFILFNPFDWPFLPTSGAVRGFALTLALGIFISLFTGVFVTRNLVRVFYNASEIPRP